MCHGKTCRMTSSRGHVVVLTRTKVDVAPGCLFVSVLFVGLTGCKEKSAPVMVAGGHYLDFNRECNRSLPATVSAATGPIRGIEPLRKL